MRFEDAVMRCLVEFSTFSGRSGRREFGSFALFCLGAAVALAILSVAAPQLAAPAAPAVLGLALPFAAVTVRRLHDLGRPGSLALLVLVPGVGLALLWLLWRRRGARGDNAYGDDPRLALALLPG